MVDRRELGEVTLDCRELRRRIQRAVVTALPRIDQHRSAARHRKCGLAIDDGGYRLAAHALRNHRHVPAQRLLVRAILGEFALRKLERRRVVTAGVHFHADQRNARLQGEVVRNSGDLLARSHRIHRVPQIIGHRVAVRMSLDVVAHASAPGIRTYVAFQHADHRLALGIGDRVKRLAGLVHGFHMLHDRMRGDHGVARHRRFARAHGIELGVPFRMQLVGGARGHPRRKAFVEPQVVPPAHGHQITKPLVRHFMRRGVEHFLLVRLRGNGRVQQQRVLERVDGTPVLHRGEELAAARRGYVVQLGQRIRHAEIIVVFLQHCLARFERERALRGQALLRDHADLRAIGRGGDAIELAGAEEQQIGGHLRRRLKLHDREPAARITLRGHRHVAHRHLRGGHGHFQIEGGLVVGLVPRRNEAAGVGIFELGVQRALLASLAVVVDGEQPVGLRADLAGVAHRQLILALGDGLVEGEGSRLVLVIHRYLGRGEGELARDRRQLHRGERHVDRIERDAGRGLQHFDIDGDLAIEVQCGRMRHHRHGVVRGTHRTRQLRGDLRCGYRSGRPCGTGEGDAGESQRNGGNQTSTHVVSLFGGAKGATPK